MQALGISTKKVVFSIKSPELLTSKKTRVHTKSTKEALLSINEILREQNKNKNIVRINIRQRKNKIETY